MKRWIDKTWAKLTAYVLTLLFAAIAVLGTLGIIILADENVFLDGGAELSDRLHGQLCDTYMEQTDAFIRCFLIEAGILDSGYLSIDIAGAELTFDSEESFFSRLTESFAAEFPLETVPCRLTVSVVNEPFQMSNFPLPAGETPLCTTVSTCFYTTTDGESLAYTVTAQLLDTRPAPSYGFLLQDWLLSHTTLTVFLTVLSALLTLFFFIFLLASAGHWPGKESIHLTWFDRIPLDVSLALLVLACMGLYDAAMNEPVWCAALLVLYTPLLFSAFAAQCKAGTVLRGTLTARLLRLVWRILRAAALWLYHLASGVPLVWKTVLVSLALIGLELLSIGALGGGVYIALKVLELLAVLWIALNLRTLQKGGESLSRGDYSQTMDTRYLVGDFKRYALRMNDLRSGMEQAVQEQMRAERLKTELITNVSHDIKTPLTSIVNYVDLLQKEDVQPPAAREYVAVLDRQSKRLKKLTEDLVDASKASSGALNVDLQPTDVGVLFSQIQGEYQERLATGELTLVTQPPAPGTIIHADSRLLSRVMDNLVSNVCKYALPATRVYVVSSVTEDTVTISFKNVSREELNISPDELMERFVRGDTSRHTEGSGLGLSIARSLVQLQGGDFRLSIDGDLFRADICFPRAT